jgi:hypothetical protein
MFIGGLNWDTTDGEALRFLSRDENDFERRMERKKTLVFDSSLVTQCEDRI